MINKLLWHNDQILYMFRKNIVEYDMQAASLSVSRRFKLIDETRLIQLEQMPKEQRTVQVGLMQKENKEFSERMIQGVIQTRQEFLDKNHIAENDILCCHSDAVIFNQKKGHIHDSIDNVKFVNKNQWTSYMYYNGIEMYYADGFITYKGIPKEKLKMHTLGINKYLIEIFQMIEDYDDNIFKHMRKFQERYLLEKLPSYYYYPFGRNGGHKIANLDLFAFLANVVLEDRYEKHW